MIEELYLTFLVLCLLFMVRNIIVYRIRRRALTMAMVLSKRKLQKREAMSSLEKLAWDARSVDRYFDMYDEHSYDELLWSAMVWTTQQAYPKLCAEFKKAVDEMIEGKEMS